MIDARSLLLELVVAAEARAAMDAALAKLGVTPASTTILPAASIEPPRSRDAALVKCTGCSESLLEEWDYCAHCGAYRPSA